jgi:hypothetical protein
VHRGRLLAWALACSITALSSGLRADDESKPASADRPVVAMCATATGTMLRRENQEKPWEIVNQHQGLAAGDMVLGLPEARLDSKNGAVGLVFLTDLNRQSPYPVIECAVRLAEAANTDLAVTLDRGRMDLINEKKEGSATVRVRVRDVSWTLVLEEPGASVALELYGRWPQGAMFTKNPGPKDVPTADLIILVLKGRATLKHENFEHALRAPPGPAMMDWDSLTGEDPTPHRLDKLPEWATPEAGQSPQAKERRATLAKFHKVVLTKGLDAAVEQFLNSDDERERRLAIIVLGAIDDIKRLGQAMREAKHRDVWENGVLVLRHWIGRGPGQDQILYKALLNSGRFTPVEAETVMQLLHSFGEDDLARPETYETLIDYLDHKNLAIRGLAAWHLCRLVPAGQKIDYNPLDPPDKRAAAIQEWKKLLPAGQLPPRTRAAQPK